MDQELLNETLLLEVALWLPTLTEPKIGMTKAQWPAATGTAGTAPSSNGPRTGEQPSSTPIARQLARLSANLFYAWPRYPGDRRRTGTPLGIANA
jgi:hypothetical protein